MLDSTRIRWITVAHKVGKEATTRPRDASLTPGTPAQLRSRATLSFTVTRPELAAVIRSLPEEEKLDLLEELWDELDHAGPVSEWHKEELDRRLDAPGAFVPWSEARARILSSK